MLTNEQRSKDYLKHQLDLLTAKTIHILQVSWNQDPMIEQGILRLNEALHRSIYAADKIITDHIVAPG